MTEPHYSRTGDNITVRIPVYIYAHLCAFCFMMLYLLLAHRAKYDGCLLEPRADLGGVRMSWPPSRFQTFTWGSIEQSQHALGPCPWMTPPPSEKSWIRPWLKHKWLPWRTQPNLLSLAHYFLPILPAAVTPVHFTAMLNAKVSSSLSHSTLSQ